MEFLSQQMVELQVMSSQPTATPAIAATLTVVVPAYNEAESLPELHRRLCGVFAQLQGIHGEVIYVEDGSTDATRATLEALCDQDPRASLLALSRNFGKEIAMTAGLDHANGDAVVVIDSDLQDPPELILRMVERWRDGFDVVVAHRTQRDGETWLKRASAAAFYRIIQRTNRVKIPADTGDFRLMSRRAILAIRKLREHHRFMKGLFAWVGFKTASIDYDRDRRFAGVSKFNYWKLWNFALEGITSFTIAPLKAATYIGLGAALLAFIFLAKIIFSTLLYGEPVRGYPTIMVTILFFGGLQLFFIGLIGEYVGRIFNETKQRPLYLVETYRPPNTPDLEAK